MFSSKSSCGVPVAGPTRAARGGRLSEFKEQFDELIRELVDERQLNEDKAARVKAIEHKVESYSTAVAL